MCATCKSAAKQSDPKVALKMVEQAIEAGRPPEHFKDLLDKILDTAEPEVNAEADEAFELGYRDRG